ncbi:MAG TPA: FtsX-like permease family protein [Chitinophagaceae bacterium]|nr:FtsX-like permease family protein [Chitinophagaceae bacterium]
MWLIKMAWKNMWRNRNRTIITMAAIFFAVLLSIITSSLKTGVFDNLIKNMVSFYAGYIQIHKQGYWNEQILDNSFSMSDSLEQKILSEGKIIAIAPRLESFALASSEDITKGCLVVGIDPEKENKITGIKNKIIQGHFFNTTDNAVMVSEGLLKRLKLKLNDTIVLIGQGYHGSTAAGKYPIIGVLKFGSPDLNDKTLFMPLQLTQDFYSAYNVITSYVLSVKNTNALSSISNNIQKKAGSNYEVMTWEQMMPDVKQHIQTDSANMQIIQGVLYLLICFGIFGTLLMMMAERRFEMGMLIAIGMKKIKLAGMLLIESVFTVIAGCSLGMLASVPIVFYLNRHPLKIKGEPARIYERFGFEAIFPTSVSSTHFITQGIIVLIIGLLLSLYPVYKTILLNPVNAMRR